MTHQMVEFMRYADLENTLYTKQMKVIISNMISQSSIDSPTEVPNNLQVVRVPGIRNEVCKQKYTGISSIISAELCAGDLDVGGIDSCKGDSGGN